jgi:hypothetical protein
MSSPDHLRGSILNCITVLHPLVGDPDKLTGPSPGFNITVSHPWVSDPTELTGPSPGINIELHYSAPPMGKPDHLRGLISNTITVPHPLVNELTGPFPLLNIEIHYSAPIVFSPEPTQLTLQFNIQLP